jgi:hypothetical protein
MTGKEGQGESPADYRPGAETGQHRMQPAVERVQTVASGVWTVCTTARNAGDEDGICKCPSPYPLLCGSN